MDGYPLKNPNRWNSIFSINFIYLFLYFWKMKFRLGTTALIQEMWTLSLPLVFYHLHSQLPRKSQELEGGACLIPCPEETLEKAQGAEKVEDWCCPLMAALPWKSPWHSSEEETSWVFYSSWVLLCHRSPLPWILCFLLPFFISEFFTSTVFCVLMMLINGCPAM